MGLMLCLLLGFITIIRYGTNTMGYKKTYFTFILLVYMGLGFISFTWSTNPG
jgi:hypothetical protein